MLELNNCNSCSVDCICNVTQQRQWDNCVNNHDNGIVWFLPKRYIILIENNAQAALEVSASHFDLALIMTVVTIDKLELYINSVYKVLEILKAIVYYGVVYNANDWLWCL